MIATNDESVDLVKYNTMDARSPLDRRDLLKRTSVGQLLRAKASSARALAGEYPVGDPAGWWRNVQVLELCFLTR